MTERLYLEDSYCWEHDASVESARDSIVILNRTCMYPGGGGQPPDSGKIVLPSKVILSVREVSRDESGCILHHCIEQVPSNSAGLRCRVRVDKRRRLALMRYHTALHVFNTVMLKMFNGWITGVSIGPDGSHIDFKVDDYSSKMNDPLEGETNKILSQHMPIKAYFISEEEFRHRPDLLRTLAAVPPVENGKIRVVEIEGFEAQACGGTHVRNTMEIGALRILKVRNKGRNNRRFYIDLSTAEPYTEV